MGWKFAFLFLTDGIWKDGWIWVFPDMGFSLLGFVSGRYLGSIAA